MTVSCVALTNAVERALPFHCTVDEAIKPVPVTVTCAELAPTTTVDGDTEDTAGAGLFTVGVGVGFGFDDPPPPPQAVSETMSATEISSRRNFNFNEVIARDLPPTGYKGAIG